MLLRTALLLCAIGFLIPVNLSAQSPAPGPTTSAEPYCSTISHGVDSGDALTSACQFAQSLLQRLPNVVCDQRTERFRAKLTTKGIGKSKRHDVVTAKVRYFEGAETYSDINIDGKAQPALLKTGAWAAGEYGPTMGFIFSEQSAAHFRFAGQTMLRSVAAVLFEFEIDRKNNQQWALQGPGSKRLYPGLKGRLWLEKTKGRVMRTEMEPIEFGDFASNQLTIQTDYDDIQLGDGSTFLLPVGSVSLSCNPQQKLCSRNLVTFQNCHRFAAKSRIVSFDEAGQTSR